MEQRKESLERAKADDEFESNDATSGAFEDKSYLAMINQANSDSHIVSDNNA